MRNKRRKKWTEIERGIFILIKMNGEIKENKILACGNDGNTNKHIVE
jgi:hypothetical protein